MASKKTLAPGFEHPTATEPPQGRRETTSRPRRVIRRLDGRVLLIALVVFAVLGGAVYGLHVIMVGRNAGVLLDQAKVEEEKGNFGEAAEHVSRYLRLRPNDVDAMEKLAGLLRRSANSRQGWAGILSSLEQVLRREPDRHEARRTAIETALKLRRFSDAETHLNILAERQPEMRQSPELMLAAARTSVGLGDRNKAVQRYLAAIDQAPATVPAYAELAELVAAKPADLPSRADVQSPNHTWKNSALPEFFPQKKGEKTAVEVSSDLLNEMIRQGKPTGQAYLARASYRSAHGDLAGASVDLKQAMEAEGTAASEVYGVAAAVELAQARASTAAGKTSEAVQHRESARDFAERGLKADSPDPKLHLLLAEISLESQPGADRAQLLADAEKHLRDGLEQVAKSRQALQPGDFEKAERLVETEVQLRWSLTDFLIDRLALTEKKDSVEALRRVADTELAALRESGCRPELIDLLGGRLLLHDHQWAEAIRHLERTRVALVAFPDLRKRVDMLLGETYRVVNNPDRRVETFRRALADDRVWEQGGVLLAKALADAGRTDEAIQQYKLVSQVPEAALEAARLTLLREWQKPEGQRDLSAVDQLLASTAGSESLAPAASLVRAQRSMAAGDVEEASASLAKASEEFPDEISLWQASVALETQRADLEADQRIAKAEDLIRAAEVRFEDRVEVRLAKVEVARLRGMEALRAELAKQAGSATELKPNQRVELFENLVRYAALTNEPKRIEELWTAIVAIRPDSIPAWLALANLRIEAGDETGSQAAIKEIRRIEGPSGPNGDYVAALWRLREIASDEALRKKPTELAKELSVQRESLKRAADQRPYWAALPRLLAMLETMAGNGDQAFAHYQRAFQLGDRSVQTVRGLIDYHYAKQAYEAADAVIQQVERETPGGISSDLARVAAQVAFAQKRMDAAIDWTKRASAGDEGLHDSLAHAHLLFLKYRLLSEDAQQREEGKKLLDEARTLYRGAIEKAPDKPETWFAYIVHFWRLGDKETALAAIEEAKTKLPAEPAAERLASLAQYYEVVQMPAEAAKHYRLAVEANPSDPRLRRVAADFFFRTGQLAEANAQLEYLLDPKNKVPEFDVTWARRGRALTTAAGGRYEDVRQALSMLRGQSQSQEEATKDLRAQLAVLSSQSTLPDRRDRIALLEQIQSRDSLSDAEKLHLASLYSQTDAWARAREVYQGLLEKNSGNSVVLSEYIAGALKHEKADAKLAASVQPRLDQLRTLEPQTIRTAITAARFENAFGRSDAAAKILTDHAERMTAADSADGETVTAQERVEVRMAADAAEDLKLFTAADLLFAAVAEHAERPEDALVLATYLGRRGRYSEGLDVCERYVAKALPDATAVTAVNVISTGPVPAEQIARAEKVVLAAQAAEPESNRILISLGGLRSIQGQHEEAESIYRRVLAAQPENVAVLNNLAWLLALTGHAPEEASRLIEDAIRLSGPVAALLDTRGTVELSRKRVDKAIADLQAAYADTPTPYIAYHLALAYDQAGNREAARESLKKAADSGLSVQELHPAELGTYRQLLDKLGMPASRA
ncbi:MAG: tetratricopeptide repeat protein [Planctomycetota bacterium]|nr:tetratricopeptide repeat protein [Planctomycetaceae bacterium]MDQ3329516.1 tetratricopeptide repeat protein [Planctomycetota bacterium]